MPIALLGEEGRGGPVLEDVIDRATLGLCAEMLGSMQAAFEMTLDYLKTRKQFGVLDRHVPGAQASRGQDVRRRSSSARSAVLGAVRRSTPGPRTLERWSRSAKARCSDAGGARRLRGRFRCTAASA